MSTKSFLKSLTMQGAAVTSLGAVGIGGAVATLLGFAGVPIEGSEVNQLIDAGTQIVGIVMVVAGRMRATTSLKVM